MRPAPPPNGSQSIHGSARGLVRGPAAEASCEIPVGGPGRPPLGCLLGCGGLGF